MIMANIRHELPRLVYLVADAIIGANQARIALGQPSVALVSLWRKTRGFPDSHQGTGRARFLVTDQLARWIEKEGSIVRRI